MRAHVRHGELRGRQLPGAQLALEAVDAHAVGDDGGRWPSSATVVLVSGARKALAAVLASSMVTSASVAEEKNLKSPTRGSRPLSRRPCAPVFCGRGE